MTNATTTTTMTSRVEAGKELVLERVFQAPRDLVFEAFSQAEHLKHWWGPRGWEVPFCTVDFRPGGKWHYCMKCVDPAQGQFFGMESWGLAVYDDIAAPQRIVYTDYFSDAEASINDSLPSTQATLVFEPAEGGTRVISRSVYPNEEGLKTVLDMGMLQGISETWDRLAEYLQAQQA